MKMSPEMQKAYEKMKPGVLTQSGFLGEDNRPLQEIIQKDEECFKKEGLEFESVSRTLENLLMEGLKGLGEPITVGNRWVVKVDEARGLIPSPFGDAMCKKVNVVINDIQSGQELLLTELSLHMMRNHHFLQGIGSPYRLDPRIIKSILT